jgi:hypothetical protein
VPGVVAQAVAALVDLVGEPVRDQVRVGRDVDAVDLDVVAGVGDDDQVVGLVQQAAGELGAARAAGEEDDGQAGTPSGQPSTKMSSASSAPSAW